MPDITILIADDEEYTHALLKKVIADKGRLVGAKDGDEAVEALQKEVVDVVLLDQKMPGLSGLEVLKKAKALDPNVVVVIMTGYGSIENAVRAMSLGAFHYMTKPFNDLDEIEVVVDKAIRERRLLNEVDYLRDQINRSFSFNGFIGKSEPVRRVLDAVRKVAPTDSNVLIQGESGTGKELIAKIIHQESPRSGNKFVAVNCGAIPESLLESTLFGFEKGSFTGALKTTKGYFEEAEGGTLFLDEITETSPKFQSSLLRILEEKEFSRVGDMDKMRADFRLVAATNRDLKKEVDSGNFREDLYYRINVVPIVLPPLRDRREDIQLLADHFLKEFNEKLDRSVGPFTPEALAALEGAEWGGNVRELANAVERIVTMKGSGPVTVIDMPPPLQESVRSAGGAFKPFKAAKRDFEKRYLEELLESADGNVARAAEKSGIRRQNLYGKMKKYGIK